MGRLDGKRVLFTGGATNIGRATVEAFVAEGARVVIGDVNAADGQALADSLGLNAHFLPVDVAGEEAIRRFVDDGVAWLGGLDVLCQNAGLQRAGPTDSFDVETWDRIFAINIRAQFLGAKHAIPHLRAHGQGGAIVNMSSNAGKRGGAGLAAYCSSKGAVVAFTNALALELAPDNIRVNALCPGWVDTQFNAAAIANLGGTEAQMAAIAQGVPLGRQARPEEIAPLYVYLASDESAFMTGQALLIDGGAHN
ncbi:SDR family NAD(P)-dependent oxidoreductase [Oceanomicrobium pacificus]|uniref:Glucose 1-dehydrogenase n=1 Tax=Oceanomicrobium pacificus TaxID=2692916 RepID=A0A6B0TTS4_9RHOB|nr:SDR family NAD(P)-dependent oxidoreductase [Oceanomicrobium pacificus]MXU64363.1 glucose 1-dehydrogenase [Oceanomicrobium pacificus]